MKYLNLPVSIGRTPQFMRATSVEIATWFALQLYCHEQMNSGKIGNCRDWPVSMWQIMHVEQAVVLLDSPLWHWGAGGFLYIHFYDLEAERNYITKMKRGKEYAMRRWDKLNRVKPVGDGSPIGSPNGSRKGHPMRKEGRKEEEPPRASAKPPAQSQTPRIAEEAQESDALRGNGEKL